MAASLRLLSGYAPGRPVFGLGPSVPTLRLAPPGLSLPRAERTRCAGFTHTSPGTPQLPASVHPHSAPCYHLSASQGRPLSLAPRRKPPTSSISSARALRGFGLLAAARTGSPGALRASGTSVSPSLQPAPLLRLPRQPQCPAPPRPLPAAPSGPPLSLRSHPRGTRPSPSPARPRAVPEPGSSLRPGPRTRRGGLSGPEERAEVPGGPGFPSRVPAAAGPRLPGAPGPRRRGRGRWGRGRGGARGGGVSGKVHRAETCTPRRRFRGPGAGGSRGPSPGRPGVRAECAGVGCTAPALPPSPKGTVRAPRHTCLNTRARRPVFARRSSRKGRAQVCPLAAGPSRVLPGAGRVLSVGRGGRRGAPRGANAEPEPAEGQTVLVVEVGTCGSLLAAADGETEARGAARPCLGGARYRPRCARGNRGSAPVQARSASTHRPRLQLRSGRGEGGAALGAPAACPAATAGTAPEQGVVWRGAHRAARGRPLLELAAQ